MIQMIVEYIFILALQTTIVKGQIDSSVAILRSHRSVEAAHHNIHFFLHVQVLVADQGGLGLSATAAVQVSVQDINDHKPKFMKRKYMYTISGTWWLHYCNSGHVWTVFNSKIFTSICKIYFFLFKRKFFKKKELFFFLKDFFKNFHFIFYQCSLQVRQSLQYEKIPKQNES